VEIFFVATALVVEIWSAFFAIGVRLCVSLVVFVVAVASSLITLSCIRWSESALGFTMRQLVCGQTKDATILA